MARLLLCLAALAFMSRAAAIRGIVLDHESGRPLARARVTLQALAEGAPIVGVRATGTGQFAFVPVPAGAYLLTASRAGFATCKYGQKAWNAPGTPIIVDENGSAFLDVRLHRLPSVAGTVWDENEIGIPDQDVVAFRATRPPVQAGRARTDDRGNYRIHSLPPGNYLVRTGARQMDEETSLLPTFYRDVASVEEARPIELHIDGQAADVNIRPLTGRLLQLSGKLTMNVTASIMLMSDMGPVGGSGGGPEFTFEHLAPGTYELTAEARMGRWPLYGYRRIQLERDMDGVYLELREPPRLSFSVRDQEGARVTARGLRLLARRKTVSGTGALQQLSLDGSSATLPPGRWELAVSTPAGYYPVSLAIQGQEGRGDAWNEAEILDYVQVEVRVSSRPATLRGRVTGSGSAPAPGAPVYLEPVDVESKRRLAELRSTRADARGEYRFTGLPPGHYRVLSSFEFEDPDERMMEAAQPRSVTLKEAVESVQDLELYSR